MSRSWVGIARASAVAVMMLPLALGGACTSTDADGLGDGQPRIFGAPFAPDLTAHSPRATTASPGLSYTRGPGPTAIVSTPSTTAVAASPTVVGDSAPSGAADRGSVNLNFQDAALAEVVQAILGDALGANYTIDPNVGGTVTISTARPIAKDDLLDVLETILQSNNASLIRQDSGYRIVESGAMAGGQADISNARPGYGITVLPLENASAAAVTRLIDGFAARPGSVRVDKTRNLLIILGSGPDREAAAETALSFDADWMRGQSVAVLPLRHAKPESIIPELERIFATGAGGAAEGVVQFMPMSRIKGILAISPSAKMIERVQGWVSRLDQENPDLEANLQVYRVKYRDASKIAELLGQLFSSSTSTTQADVAIEPDASEIVEAAFSATDEVQPPRSAGAPGAPTVGLGVSATTTASGDGPRIRADKSNNSIVIYADRETRRQIVSALAEIDVPQLQVAINVTMAEVRLTDELRYGVQYFLKSGDLGLGRDNGSIGLFRTLANNVAREVPGFNFVVGSESAPDIILNALDTLTDLRVLSSPSLVVTENEVAKFQVGDEIPIITRTVTSVDDADAPISNQVEYRDTGIIMSVKPRIAENGVVTMLIQQEISSVTGNAATLTPTISNRSIQTSVSVVDGQTVMLGGLISEQNDRGKDGIPGLHKLKGVGNLFGSTAKGDTRTELLILIRPSVIRSGQDARHVAEEMQARMWNLAAQAPGKR